MKYKTVIFDLDGTLLDTLGDLADAVNYALETNGYPEHTKEEICSFVGNGIRNLMKKATPTDIEEIDFEKCFETFKDYYSENMYVTTCPYEGIMDILKYLKECNIKTAIVSNKADFAVKALSERFFEGLIDVSVGARDNLALKPASDTVDYALKMLGVSNEESVYIGDSDVDILTANNANMPCISVSWGFRDEEFLREYGAKVIVKNTGELMEML